MYYVTAKSRIAPSEVVDDIEQCKKKATEYVMGLDRKQRIDMNKNGLEIKAVCLGTEKKSSVVTRQHQDYSWIVGLT